MHNELFLVLENDEYYYDLTRDLVADSKGDVHHLSSSLEKVYDDAY